MKKFGIPFVLLMIFTGPGHSVDYSYDDSTGPKREDIEAGRAPRDWRATDQHRSLIERQESAVQRQEDVTDMLEEDEFERQEEEATYHRHAPYDEMREYDD